MTDLTRLSVNMNPETTRKLQELMARHGKTATDVIANAIATHHFVDTEVGVGGRQIRFNPKHRWREYIDAEWLGGRNWQ